MYIFGIDIPATLIFLYIFITQLIIIFLLWRRHGHHRH